MHIEEISSIFVYSNTFKEMLSENVQKLSEKCKCQCRINIELRFLSRGWFWMLVQISWVIQHFAILKQGVFCSMTIIRSSGNLTHESLMISARSNWGEKRQLCLRTVKFKPSHHLFLLIWRVWNFTLTKNSPSGKMSFLTIFVKLAHKTNWYSRQFYTVKVDHF